MKNIKYVLILILCLAFISCQKSVKINQGYDLLDALMSQYLETNNYFVNKRQIDKIPINKSTNNLIIENTQSIFSPQFIVTNQVMKFVNSEGINILKRISREKYRNSEIAIVIEYQDYPYNYFVKSIKDNKGFYIRWNNDSFYSKFNKLYNTPISSDGDHVNWDIGIFTDTLQTNLSYETVKLYFPDFNGVYVYNPNVSIKILENISDKNIDSLKYLVKFENK